MAARLNSGKNIRLFENDLLEQMTYVHPLVPLLIWGPFVAFCFAWGLYRGEISLEVSIALAIAGLFIWTLSEYLLHRYVFHFKPKGAFQKRIAFLIHGIHHEDPEDARRLLMPPTAAIAIASVFYVFFMVAFGTIAVKPFFAGFIFGYLCYDYTHFAVHFMRPKTKFFKTLKQNHMKHHFVTPEARYGVSNTLWDHIFGSRG